MNQPLEILVYGWGVYDGPPIKKNDCLFYTKWYSVVERGYSPTFKAKTPTYETVTVNNEWRHFSNFKLWMDEQPAYVNMHLDKDILVMGNKEYGSDTCCFVPQYINKLLNTNRNSKINGLPLGVCISRGSTTNTYVAQCRIDGNKGRHIGTFSSTELAHRAWQLAKIVAIESAILKYMLEPCYRQDVANAIYLRAEMLRDDHANNRETFSL